MSPWNARGGFKNSKLENLKHLALSQKLFGFWERNELNLLVKPSLRSSFLRCSVMACAAFIAIFALFSMLKFSSCSSLNTEPNLFTARSPSTQRSLSLVLLAIKSKVLFSVEIEKQQFGSKRIRYIAIKREHFLR
jgi:hypothetical protein